MPEFTLESEGADLIIEIEGADEDALDELRRLFNGDEEDVTFSHSFGGLDVLTIITKLTQATLGKLIDVWGKLKLASTRTKLTINQHSLSLEGFSPEAVESLLASPGFKQALRSVHKR